MSIGFAALKKQGSPHTPVADPLTEAYVPACEGVLREGSAAPIPFFKLSDREFVLPVSTYVTISNSPAPTTICYLPAKKTSQGEAGREAHALANCCGQEVHLLLRAASQSTLRTRVMERLLQRTGEQEQMEAQLLSGVLDRCLSIGDRVRVVTSGDGAGVVSLALNDRAEQAKQPEFARKLTVELFGCDAIPRMPSSIHCIAYSCSGPTTDSWNLLDALAVFPSLFVERLGRHAPSAGERSRRSPDAVLSYAVYNAIESGLFSDVTNAAILDAALTRGGNNFRQHFLELVRNRQNGQQQALAIGRFLLPTKMSVSGNVFNVRAETSLPARNKTGH